MRTMKQSIGALICCMFLGSCYKDPLYNEKSFLVGKWKLEHMTIPERPWSGTSEVVQEIPFEFVVEIEKKGVWKEYMNGVLLDKWRIEFTNLYKNEENFQNERIALSLVKLDALIYSNCTNQQISFDINISNDTIQGVTYPPKSIYPYERVFFSSSHDAWVQGYFTFVKIE